MITLSAIRHPRFRVDQEDYLRSKAEWLEVFNAALEPHDPAVWEDWLRDPFSEGAPIFSRINRATRKGVVINQIAASDDELPFRSYLDVFAEGSDSDEVEHLVLTTTLTEEAKQRAGRLIRAYLADSHAPSLP